MGTVVDRDNEVFINNLSTYNLFTYVVGRLPGSDFLRTRNQSSPT